MAGVSKLAALRFIALLAVLSFLSACGETHSWREKTILEVETPSGLVTGGSVAEVTVHWFGWLEGRLSASAVNSGKRGEASFVEVAPGKYLFALTLDSAAPSATRLFKLSDGEDPKSVTARLETLRETRVVPPSLYPRFVTFTDVSSPKSVKLVDPADLAAAFGPGFALRSVKLELTDEKVTEGVISKLLQWTADENPTFVDWRDYPFDHPLRKVNKRSFIVKAN
jgi:hypothetical protein